MPSAHEPLYVDYGLPLFHGYQQLSDAVSSLAAPVALVPRLSLTSHFLNSPSLASPFELASKWQLDGTATSPKRTNSRVEAHNGELLTRPTAPSSTCRHASAEHPVAMRGSDSERAERGDDGLWALHQEACAGLALSCPSFCVASDFQAPEKARPFRLDEADGGFACSGADWQWKGQHSGRQRFEIAMHGLDGAAGVFDGAGGAYTISSNPPKAKTSFRIGDWICTVPNCAAHNFGRNATCIRCGQPRSEGGRSCLSLEMAALDGRQVKTVSPRFSADRLGRGQGAESGVPGLLSSRAYSAPVCSVPRISPLPQTQTQTQTPVAGSKGPRASYPLLTPSGRALSVGGRVQNISQDAMAPCMMYWPDNEGLPEQGQIRPLGCAVLSYPPIVNTGNKGAAEKQPGDWVCEKCHYLNWRRRKVCQTCYPYAEGNGDSISAAVQAERIALLANVLAAQADGLPRAPDAFQSVAPAAFQPLAPARPLVRPALDTTLPWLNAGHSSPRADSATSPIYESPARVPFAPSSFAQAPPATPAPTPTATLLPSFLQDIVQPPSLSPTTSASSAELSLEEYHDAAAVPRGVCGAAQVYSPGTSAFGLEGGSIWKFDGEETRSLAAIYATPSPTRLAHRQERCP
ncbi:hypothetical protein AcV7_010147 [Taiwanofungus camphoratus]|nr:hypothetical protein AcV7_010147 [Antrodia cinnamomea]